MATAAPISITANSHLFNNYISSLEDKSVGCVGSSIKHGETWKITDKNGNTWYVCAQSIAHYNSQLSNLKKQIFKTTKFGPGSFKCHICATHAKNVGCLFGPGEKFIFQIGNEESKCYHCITKLSSLVRRIKEVSLENIKHFRLRLCTDELLYHHEKELGADPIDGDLLKHYIGHADCFHSQQDINTNNNLKTIDKALQDLTLIMYNFFIKLRKISGYNTLKSRLDVIKNALENSTYGHTYLHATNWLIDCLPHIFHDQTSNYNIDNIINKIPGIITAIVNSNLGLDENNLTISFDLQQANNAILNWLVTSSNKQHIIELINSTLDPNNYKQRKSADCVSGKNNNISLPSSRHFEATRKALGKNGKDFAIIAAGLSRTKVMRPENTFVKSYRALLESNSSAQAFDKINHLGNNKKSKVPDWDDIDMFIDNALNDDDLTVCSLFTLLEKLPVNYEMLIRSTFFEFASLVEIQNTDPSYWHCNTNGKYDDIAYSWQFMGTGISKLPSVAIDTAKWYNLQGGHILSGGNMKNAIFIINYHNSCLWSTLNNIISSNTQTIGIGSWALSSKGERNHGKTLMNVCSLIKAKSCDHNDVPIVGIGVSANLVNINNSQVEYFHSKDKKILWRIKYPNGMISETKEIKYFTKPKPHNINTGDEVRGSLNKVLDKEVKSIEDKLKAINHFCDVGLINKETRDKKISDLIDRM